MDLNSIIIRNLIFPLMEKFKGNNIQKDLSYLKRTQFLSEKDIKKLQEEKLRKLLLYCIENVPAYYPFRNLSSQIEYDPINSLKKFPVITKQQFRKASSDYLSRKINEKNLIPNRTGGSTGEPVQFYLDRHTVEFYEAARWRGLSWWDIHIGDSSAMIWGSPIELT